MRAPKAASLQNRNWLKTKANIFQFRVKEYGEICLISFFVDFRLIYVCFSSWLLRMNSQFTNFTTSLSSMERLQYRKRVIRASKVQASKAALFQNRNYVKTKDDTFQFRVEDVERKCCIVVCCDTRACDIITEEGPPRPRAWAPLPPISSYTKGPSLTKHLKY